MTGIIQLLTGARPNEQRKTLTCFLALFMLMLSYYLIKPARQSQFLKDFDPEQLPEMYLIIPILSFSVTRVFNWLYDRVDRYKLILGTYLAIMACKVGFTALLPVGGKFGSILFMLWGSVYFLLALPAMWACINDIFTPDQGERCFGFVTMGATIGGLCASASLHWIINQGLKDYALLLSAVAMGIALAVILATSRAEIRRRALEGDDGQRASRKIKGLGKREARPSEAGLFGDVRDLWAIPYVRAIAVMVVCLALYNSSTTFLSLRILDQRMAERQYMESYADLNRTLNEKAGLPPDALNREGQQMIYRLKATRATDRQAQIEAFLAGQGVGVKLAPGILDAYAGYADKAEGKTRQFMADINIYQGLTGIFLLAIVSRYLFRYVGLRVAACILPCFAFISIIAWGSPIDLFMVGAILTIGGSLNYSLNNATKELLYTMTTQETKFKYKPLIDGPGQRLGALSAAILNIVLVGGFARMGYPEWAGVWLLVALVLAGIVWWFRSVYFVGGEYDRVRREEKGSSAP